MLNERISDDKFNEIIYTITNYKELGLNPFNIAFFRIAHARDRKNELMNVVCEVAEKELGEVDSNIVQTLQLVLSWVGGIDDIEMYKYMMDTQIQSILKEGKISVNAIYRYINIDRVMELLEIKGYDSMVQSLEDMLDEPECGIVDMLIDYIRCKERVELKKRINSRVLYDYDNKISSEEDYNNVMVELESIYKKVLDNRSEYSATDISNFVSQCMGYMEYDEGGIQDAFSFILNSTTDDIKLELTDIVVKKYPKTSRLINCCMATTKEEVIRLISEIAYHHSPQSELDRNALIKLIDECEDDGIFGGKSLVDVNEILKEDVLREIEFNIRVMGCFYDKRL